MLDDAVSIHLSILPFNVGVLLLLSAGGTALLAPDLNYWCLYVPVCMHACVCALFLELVSKDAEGCSDTVCRPLPLSSRAKVSVSTFGQSCLWPLVHSHSRPANLTIWLMSNKFESSKSARGTM